MLGSFRFFGGDLQKATWNVKLRSPMAIIFAAPSSVFCAISPGQVKSCYCLIAFCSKKVFLTLELWHFSGSAWENHLRILWRSLSSLPETGIDTKMWSLEPSFSHIFLLIFQGIRNTFWSYASLRHVVTRSQPQLRCSMNWPPWNCHFTLGEAQGCAVWCEQKWFGHQKHQKTGANLEKCQNITSKE